MDFKSLRYFLAVAEELHFGKAAARLHISQPPLTVQIQNLEARLDAQLFVRDKRSVRLTPAGEALVPEARSILAMEQHATHAVQLAAAGRSGLLRIGFSSSALFGGMGAAVESLRPGLPGGQVSWREVRPAQQVAALLNSRMDLGLVTLPLAHKSLASHVVAQEKLVLALPATHPLAGADIASLHAVADDEFVLFGRSGAPEYHDLIVSACSDAGFSPRITHRASHLVTILQLVALGYGVSLVPGSLQRLRLQRVVLKAVDDLDVRLKVGVLWRPDDDRPLLRCALRTLGVFKPEPD